MDSELKFLFDLLFNKRSAKEIKSLLQKRIEDVMETMQKPITAPKHPIQAASTQSLIEAQAAHIDAIPVPKRIVGGEVATGNGTRGPRKF